MKVLMELFLTFLKIGAFTFGGGYAMISLIENECVEDKKWLSSEEFLDMTVIAESTPGPIAINCATFTGYKIAGIKGAFVSTLGVVIPSFFIILIILSFLQHFLEYELVVKAFKGVKVAVAILITRAGFNLLKSIMKKKEDRIFNIVFVISFFLILFLMNFIAVHISSIYLIVIAGVLGLVFFNIKNRNIGGGS